MNKKSNQDAGNGRRAARPRDAATLVLYKMRRGQPCILMGLRHSKHKFMPDQYVFPGGRVDRTDGYVPAATELQRHVASRLVKAAGPHRARALAMAAIRETHEETGLLLGEKISQAPGRLPDSWQPFFDTGLAPALDRLEYICRAITPPFRPIRFNARFFLAKGDELTGKLEGSGELLDLDWVPLKKALTLPKPRIQEVVLNQLTDLIDDSGEIRRPRRVPVQRMLYGKRIQEFE
jgi:8-oxo-dGTP pyrophosphatase MutT (NUDIX family)